MFVGPGIVRDGLRFVAAALECGSFTDDIYISYHSFLQDVLRICRSSICPWWLWLSLLSFFRRCQWYSHTSWMHAIIWTSQMCMNVSSHSFSKLDETEICQNLPKVMSKCVTFHLILRNCDIGSVFRRRMAKTGRSDTGDTVRYLLSPKWSVSRWKSVGKLEKCWVGFFLEITFGGFWCCFLDCLRRSFWSNSSPLAVWARP